MGRKVGSTLYDGLSAEDKIRYERMMRNRMAAQNSTLELMPCLRFMKEPSLPVYKDADEAEYHRQLAASVPQSRLRPEVLFDSLGRWDGEQVRGFTGKSWNTGPELCFSARQQKGQFFSPQNDYSHFLSSVPARDMACLRSNTRRPAPLRQPGSGAPTQEEMQRVAEAALQRDRARAERRARLRMEQEADSNNFKTVRFELQKIDLGAEKQMPGNRPSHTVDNSDTIRPRDEVAAKARTLWAYLKCSNAAANFKASVKKRRVLVERLREKRDYESKQKINGLETRLRAKRSGLKQLEAESERRAAELAALEAEHERSKAELEANVHECTQRRVLHDLLAGDGNGASLEFAVLMGSLVAVCGGFPEHKFSAFPIKPIHWLCQERVYERLARESGTKNTISGIIYGPDDYSLEVLEEVEKAKGVCHEVWLEAKRRANLGIVTGHDHGFDHLHSVVMHYAGERQPSSLETKLGPSWWNMVNNIINTPCVGNMHQDFRRLYDVVLGVREHRARESKLEELRQGSEGKLQEEREINFLAAEEITALEDAILDEQDRHAAYKQRAEEAFAALEARWAEEEYTLDSLAYEARELLER